MASPHGIQLAADLISSFYGNLCTKVCECLLRHGTLTLPQIIRLTELTRENVINCLRVLIHQNCVQAFTIQQEGGFGEAPRIVTQYMALFDNIIHKLRAAKFMQIVSEELGNDCLKIFEALLQHGRLSFNQIVDRNKQIAVTDRLDSHIVHQSFNQLLNNRFIERCPAPEPFLAPPSEEEGGTKKRGTKATKISLQSQTMEQRALAAAAPSESVRFLMETDDYSEEITEKTTAGKKRKQDAVVSEKDILDINKKKEILWRVNFEEFVRRLRNKACISYIKQRNSNEAAIVLSAILELSGRREHQVKTEKSACLSINAIYDEVIKKEGGVGLDFQHVRNLLNQLECENISTGLDESYIFDIKRTIEMAQSEEVESVVLRRHGREAYRIFRYLSKIGRLVGYEKIADATFIEKKDAHKILYKLLSDNYLHMEQLQQFVHWKVNKQALQKQVLDEMYHAALNLRLRVAHELDQGKEIIQLPEHKRVGDLGEKVKRLSKIKVVLESSLFKLDDGILLFHDF